jgi:hypothetical protein
MLYDLEYFIYHQGYGPTNETLGKFMRELFGPDYTAPAPPLFGGTDILEKTARLTSTKLECDSA